jgi:hypothetical protein
MRNKVIQRDGEEEGGEQESTRLLSPNLQHIVSQEGHTCTVTTQPTLPILVIQQSPAFRTRILL